MRLNLEIEACEEEAILSWKKSLFAFYFFTFVCNEKVWFGLGHEPESRIGPGSRDGGLEEPSHLCINIGTGESRIT